MGQPEAGVIDVHAHHLPATMTDWAERTGDTRWPVLITDDGTSGRLLQNGAIFRKVAATLWDVAARLRELDENGIAAQLVSPMPVTLTYWAETSLATRYAREMNGALAADVGGAGGRLVGLGTVPLQDVDAAIGELEYAVRDLGLAGVEIGTVIGGRELDDPTLRPFFAAAQDLDAVILIHPMDGGAGAIRRSGQPYDFGLGMLTDTAMAAGALVFGGVLQQFPDLRIVLAHGCGTFCWSFPRMRLMAATTAPQTDFADLAAKLYVDTLVFAEEHFGLMLPRFGADHILMGTDYPFVPGQLQDNPALVRRAAADGLLTAEQCAAVLGSNAASLLGLASDVTTREVT